MLQRPGISLVHVCCLSVNSRTHAFTLSGNTQGQNAVSSMVSNSCNDDWLIIPCATNAGRTTETPTNCIDRICGGTLSAEASSTPATVISKDVYISRLVVHNITVLGFETEKKFSLICSVRCSHNTDLTLRLLMSYIYGAPSKARNANVVYIWTYVWQR